MRVGVGVVTDSTASLPDGVAERHGVGVVPLHVVLGRRTGKEGIEVSGQDVARALGERRVAVTTSRPTPAELAVAYRAGGHHQVVSVHLSSALSGTLDSARLAAREVSREGIEVRVVDSRTTAMGLGFAVLAAARTARDGGGVDAVVSAAERALARTSLLFCVGTLEHLRRGGRIGAAAALVGTALAVKPLLHVVDGAIAPLERIRTTSRAVARLEELVVAAAQDGPVDVAVHHLAEQDRAEALADRLAALLPHVVDLSTSEVGAAVAAHVGPGLLGVVLHRREAGPA